LGHYQRSRGGIYFLRTMQLMSGGRLDVEADAVDASAALLSDAELQRASRFAFERDRTGSLPRAHGCVNCLPSGWGGTAIDRVEYGTHGKPR